MIRIVVIGLMGVVGVVGCGDGDDQGRDASIGGEGGSGGVGGGGSGGSGGGAQCFETPALARQLGGACTGATMDECKPGLACIPEQAGTIGGPDDPIMNYPPGEDVPIDAPFFLGSYCADEGATGCDPIACDAECGFCTPLAAGLEICMNLCLPELGTNSICRDGYQCDLFDFVCFPGCTSDDECRVSRQGEQLVYNPSSEAVCNMETYRCEHPGTPGAEAGTPCTFNDDCEANGVCLTGPDGYCSKFGCDIAGNECVGDGACAFGQCLAPCDVGSGATPGDPSTYLNNTQGCRGGYTCLWGRGEGDPAGFCDIGVFNDVAVNNIGSACVSDDECYSPFGYGRCDVDFGCTVIECGAPGLPADICGADATCIDFIDFGIDAFACLKKCASAVDCLPGDACADLDEDPMTLDDIVCFPFCVSSDECRPGEVCDVNNQCVTP